jgi:hypothetical protein
MSGKNIPELLKDGNRRSIGRSDQVATMVSKNLQLFPELIAGLWSKDPLVRMRAADAAEKDLYLRRWRTRADPRIFPPTWLKVLALLGNEYASNPDPESFPIALERTETRGIACLNGQGSVSID